MEGGLELTELTRMQIKDAERLNEYHVIREWGYMVISKGTPSCPDLGDGLGQMTKGVSMNTETRTRKSHL